MLNLLAYIVIKNRAEFPKMKKTWKYLESKNKKFSIGQSAVLHRNWWQGNVGIPRSDITNNTIPVDIDNYFPKWKNLVCEDISRFRPSFPLTSPRSNASSKGNKGNKKRRNNKKGKR